jgi:hypothetical protein
LRGGGGPAIAAYGVRVAGLACCRKNERDTEKDREKETERIRERKREGGREASIGRLHGQQRHLSLGRPKQGQKKLDFEVL